METLSKITVDPILKDCHGTLAFIERFNKLIDVMNSKCAAAAIRRRDKDKNGGNTNANNPVIYDKIGVIYICLLLQLNMFKFQYLFLVFGRFFAVDGYVGSSQPRCARKEAFIK